MCGKGFRRERDLVAAAFGSVRTNGSRSVLTVSIMATGIMALVGVLTASESLRVSVSESFTRMGADSFSLVSRPPSRLSYAQVCRFRESGSVTGAVTVFAAEGMQVVAAGRVRTDPTVTLIAADAAYLAYAGAGIARGRGLVSGDLENGASCAVLGAAVARRLFGGRNPVGASVSLAGNRLTVVGVLEEQGSAGTGGLDAGILVPVTRARAGLLGPEADYAVGVRLRKGSGREREEAAAVRVFRSVRRLQPAEPDDFELRRDDAAVSDFQESMRMITSASLLAGAVILLGAAVGLMNTMLVSVKERTREIGTRKALGARSGEIRRLFLWESVLLGQLGCAGGTLLGLIAGNATAWWLETAFVVPWKWLLLAVCVCFAVSILAGGLPARRAAEMHPVDALRCE